MHGVDESQREAGEFGHRAGNVAQHPQFRSAAPAVTGGRVEGHPAAADRSAHRPPDVDLAGPMASLLARHVGRQAAGQRSDGGAHGLELGRRCDQEIDVVQRRPARGSVGLVSQTTPNFISNFPAQSLDAHFKFGPSDALVQRGSSLATIPAGGERPLQGARKVRGSLDPLEVIALGAPERGRAPCSGRRTVWPRDEACSRHHREAPSPRHR